MSGNPLEAAKYATAKEGVLQLILDESDKRIAAQVQLMLSADTRATAVLSGCVTLATGGLGFAVSKLSSLDAMAWAALTLGLVGVAASVLALWAIWPQQIRPQGWSPEMFKDDLGKSKTDIQSEVAVLLQERIDANRDCARRLSNRIKGAMLLAALSPAAGLSTGLWVQGQVGWSVVAILMTGAALVWLSASLVPDAKTRA
jgi:hypothetical protein